MPAFDRRQFVATALGGLAGACVLPQGLRAVQTTDTAAAATKVIDAPPSAANTLFLTWQRDPTTTMTIQWIGPAIEPAPQLQFGALADTQWKSAPVRIKPFPDTDWKVYRCELTGLAPGSEYKFQIGQSLESYRFRTMPATATDQFRFVTGGDAGIDSHALASNRLAALQNPNFALIAGDLAYDNGKSPETFVRFVQNYHATMFDADQRMIPLISCLGNHEVRGGYNAKREDAPHYLAMFDGLFEHQTYNTLDFGNYLSLVLMDTGHISPITGAQTEWLQKTLADRQEYPHLIVANHVPAYPSYRAPEGAKGSLGTGEDQRRHWCPLFERYKVDVVLEHHDHTFKRTHPLIDGRRDPNGLVYLGDGSWGKLRVPKTPEERPYLAKVAQAYHMTLHALEGDRRFHLAIEDTGRIADITSTVNKRASRRG